MQPTSHFIFSRASKSNVLFNIQIIFTHFKQKLVVSIPISMLDMSEIQPVFKLNIVPGLVSKLADKLAGLAMT